MFSKTIPETTSEKKITITLALVLALRITGLCMIIPVLELYSNNLTEVTPFLIGVAIGIYGITQAFCQIPLGMLSDKIGRKPVILVGLIVFTLGSLIAATADSIYLIILGRSIQGAGAISSVILALATDIVKEENRVKTLAAIGASIGVGFAVALPLGTFLANYLQLKGLFIVAAALSMIAIAIIVYNIPAEPKNKTEIISRHNYKELLGNVLKDRKLFKINLGIFKLHFVLTLFFLAIPKLLVTANLAKEDHWLLYLIAFSVSFIFLIPMMIASSRNNNKNFNKVFSSAIMMLITALSLLFFAQNNQIQLISALILFFVGFNYLEASLPSLVSKKCNPKQKGAAMGVYSSCQFVGAFLGGIIGGFIYNNFDTLAILATATIMSFLWLLITNANLLINKNKTKQDNQI